MKCSKCENESIAEVKWKNKFYCKEHYNEYYLGQVKKVIDKYKIDRSSKICVALSGGKDSTSALAALLKLGFKNISGVHVSMGERVPASSAPISYSEIALRKCEEICKFFNVKLDVINLKDDYDISLVKLFEKNKRKAVCKVCSTVRRYVLNEYGFKRNFDYVATGHNLSDVTAQGFNSLLSNYFIGFRNLMPVQEANKEFKLVGRFKPLFFLTDNEDKIFADINKFPYSTERCALALKSPPPLYAFKKFLNSLEEEKPGTLRKLAFSYIELGKRIEKFKEDREKFKICKICGNATSSNICSFCKLTKKYKTSKSIKNETSNKCKRC